MLRCLMLLVGIAFACHCTFTLSTAFGQTPDGTPELYAAPAAYPAPPAPDPYAMKLAYGRTFGTSTELDYATIEFSRKVNQYPTDTLWGPARGEVAVALLASYVVYSEGARARLRKLNFRDGFELAWVPKGRVVFPAGELGFAPYLESGAGVGYVSETYRNSGSRWNWSFMGGMGFERCVPGGVFAMGVQWRHMCNGNMWGKGDELHNSNSGTDMLQGLAVFRASF